MVYVHVLSSALLLGAPAVEDGASPGTAQTEPSAAEVETSLEQRLAPYLMEQVTLELSNGAEVHGTLARVDGDAGRVVVMDEALEDVVVDAAAIERVTVYPATPTPPDTSGAPEAPADTDAMRRQARQRRRQLVLDDEVLRRQRAVNIGLMAGGGTLMATGVVMCVLGSFVYSSSVADTTYGAFGGVGDGPGSTDDLRGYGPNVGLIAGGGVSLAAGVAMLTVGGVRNRRLMRPHDQVVLAPSLTETGGGLILHARF